MACNTDNIVGGIGILRIVSDEGTFENLRLVSEPSYKTTTGENEAIAGVGVTVSESNSYIEAEIYDNRQIDPNVLGNLCNVTVTYREAHGRSQTWFQADIVGGVEKSGNSFTMRFESNEPAQIALGQ